MLWKKEASASERLTYLVNILGTLTLGDELKTLNEYQHDRVKLVFKNMCYG